MYIPCPVLLSLCRLTNPIQRALVSKLLSSFFWIAFPTSVVFRLPVTSWQADLSGVTPGNGFLLLNPAPFCGSHSQGTSIWTFSPLSFSGLKNTMQIGFTLSKIPGMQMCFGFGDAFGFWNSHIYMRYLEDEAET